MKREAIKNAITGIVVRNILPLMKAYYQSQERSDIVFLIMQKGGSQFATSVFKELSYHDAVPEFTTDTYHSSGWGSNHHAGELKVIARNTVDLKDKVVIILEDIIDTGAAMNDAINACNHAGARSIYVFALAGKPEKLKHKLNANAVTVCFQFGKNDYLIGRGLDECELHRAADEITAVPADEPVSAPRAAI